MTDFNLFADLYLEANILLGIVWILWIVTKRIVKTLGIESTNQKQLLIARLLFLALFISPVIARSLPSVSLESLRMQRESIEEVIGTPLSKTILPFSFTTSRTTSLPYLSEPAEPLSRISGLSLRQVEWQHGLYFLIGVGFFIQGVRIFRQILKLRDLIQNSYHWRRIGKIHLMISEETSVPFSTKIFGKNHIVIPTNLLASPKYLRVALAHEGQHLRNGDLLWEILMEGIKLICYWNPAVYLWKAELIRLREYACDEAIMGRHQISSYIYGNCLLQIAKSFSSPGFLLAGIASMGASSFFHRNGSSQLKRRIQMLVTQNKTRFLHLKAGILGGMLLLGTVIFAVILLGSSSKAADPVFAQTDCRPTEGWATSATSLFPGVELSAIQKEVWKMEKLYFELCKKGDAEGLYEMIHKDSVIWGNVASWPKGRTNFNMGATGPIIHGRIDCFELKPHKIKVLGNTSISAFTARLQWLGKPYRFRIIHTWIKQDGKWQMIGAMHDSCSQLPTCP